MLFRFPGILDTVQVVINGVNTFPVFVVDLKLQKTVSSESSEMKNIRNHTGPFQMWNLHNICRE